MSWLPSACKIGLRLVDVFIRTVGLKPFVLFVLIVIVINADLNLFYVLEELVQRMHINFSTKVYLLRDVPKLR